GSRGHRGRWAGRAEGSDALETRDPGCDARKPGSRVCGASLRARALALHRARDTKRASRTVVAPRVLEILGAGHVLELGFDLPVAGTFVLLLSHLRQRALERAF